MFGSRRKLLLAQEIVQIEQRDINLLAEIGNLANPISLDCDIKEQPDGTTPLDCRRTPAEISAWIARVVATQWLRALLRTLREGASRTFGPG